MVGILGKSEAAKAALTAPPYRRAFYRLLWLLVGMAGSATMMMTRFESALAAHIAVAFFIPAIVYLADAVGTQSEAVAVRGLSLSGAGFRPACHGSTGCAVAVYFLVASVLVFRFVRSGREHLLGDDTCRLIASHALIRPVRRAAGRPVSALQL